MENKVIKKKRMSLKWKWAIGTGVGVLLIFALFSFFVFKIVTDSLYAEEHRDVESTVTQVRSRLQNANEINYKTTDIFRPDLNQKSAVNNNQGGFNDSLLASLTRRDLVVSV